MARVLLVTDSSACLPEPVAHRTDVRVLPITVLFPTAEWPDGPAVAPLVYSALGAGQPVRSSPPSAVDYVNAAEEGSYDGAVIITPAAEFTVMYRNARVAARLAERAVEVIDCRTAAAAQSLVVLAALEAAEAGAGLVEVAAAARHAARRAELLAALPTPGAVERNALLPPRSPGRVVAGTGALFRFSDGAVTHTATLLPGADQIEALAQAWTVGDGRPEGTLVFHAADAERAAALSARLAGTPAVVPFSPAMAIHTGPGWIGAAWLRPGPPDP